VPQTVQFLIRQVVPSGRTLRCEYNPERITVSGGVGGWSEVPRPKRTAAVEWDGSPLSKLDLPLVFDGSADLVSVEGEIDVLRDWGRPPRDGLEPPVLQVLYGGLDRYRWVLQDLTFGEEDRRFDGRRVYAEVGVQLLEHVGLLGTPTAAQSVRADLFGADPLDVSLANQRRYTTRLNETLGGVALRQLGKQARWREVAKLNPALNQRDPAHPLREGTRLVLPPT
jgi:hypothetical protein